MGVSEVANLVKDQAEGEGFEPPRACALPVFKCGEYCPAASLTVPSGVLQQELTIPVVPMDHEYTRCIPES